MRIIDMFSGIGGFHQAASQVGWSTVLACEIDKNCRKAYEANYSLTPHTDITTLKRSLIPDYEVLCGGFPCQPFSTVGRGAGFRVQKGLLYLELLRILKSTMPPYFLFENVRNITTVQKGMVFRVIMEDLAEAGYHVFYRVMNAMHYGSPQSRPRCIMVGIRNDLPWSSFKWPETEPFVGLEGMLDPNPPAELWMPPEYRLNLRVYHTRKYDPLPPPSTWRQERWAGHDRPRVFSQPYCYCILASDQKDRILVNGDRMLTVRERLNAQGFPQSFKIVCSNAQTNKQAGNSVPIPLIFRAMRSIADVETTRRRQTATNQIRTMGLAAAKTQLRMRKLRRAS